MSLLLISGLISKGQANDTTRARFFADSAWKTYQGHYFRKSVRLLDSAISYDPSKSFYYHLKSEAQWFVGDYSAAAETHKKMISLDSDNLLKVSAYVFLGMLYGKAGMPVQAVEQYAFAIKLWENGYVPHKQFNKVEESDYFLALAFLNQKEKAMKLIGDRSLDGLSYPRRHELETQNRRYLALLDKTPKELLDQHFKDYMLPDDIKPLEE